MAALPRKNGFRQRKSAPDRALCRCAKKRSLEVTVFLKRPSRQRESSTHRVAFARKNARAARQVQHGLRFTSWCLPCEAAPQGQSSTRGVAVLPEKKVSRQHGSSSDRALCPCAKKRSRRTTSATSSAKAKLDSRGQLFLENRVCGAGEERSRRARSTTYSTVHLGAAPYKSSALCHCAKKRSRRTTSTTYSTVLLGLFEK